MAVPHSEGQLVEHLVEQLEEAAAVGWHEACDCRVHDEESVEAAVATMVSFFPSRGANPSVCRG